MIKHKHIAAFTSILVIVSLTGCSKLPSEMNKAIDNKDVIAISVTENSYDTEREKITWTELDQLNTYKDLRREWDDELNILKFDENSKNGCLFIDDSGDWAGNSVLLNAFKNKVFVKDYLNESTVRSKLSQKAMEEFKDISNESTGFIASVNAYFNILPANADGTSGLMNYLTRAEAMTAVYRADTPVILLEENDEFNNTIGYSDYNVYASQIEDCSYLRLDNGGLNKYTFNTTMTRAEAVYLLIQRYYKDEYENYDVSSSSLTDCKNGGDILKKNKISKEFAPEAFALEYSLQNKSDGAPYALYKALSIANVHGIIGDTTRWNEGITGGELIQMIINTYNSLYNDSTYPVNSKFGNNTGDTSLLEKDKEPEPEKQETELGNVVVEKIKNIASIDDLISIYGNELTMTDEEITEAKKVIEGWTIEACDKHMLVDHCNYLNVRTGPSTDYKIIKSIPKGTDVHIVGKCKENGWYRVIADGHISYQCDVYFSDLEGADTSNLVQEYE